MREKLLAKLKAQYPGLPNELLGLLADCGVAKVTEESQIEGYVTELESLPIAVADLLQRHGDKRVTDAEKKWKEESKKPEEKKVEEAKKPEDDLKAFFLEKFTELDAKINGVTAQKKAESAKEKLEKVLAEKGIPSVFALGRTVEKEEDVDALVAQIEPAYAAYKQEQIDKGLMTATAPAGGDKGAGKQASKEEIAEIMSQM